MIKSVSVGATSTAVLDPDSHRQRVYLVNISNERIDISPGGLAEAGAGISLGANGGSFTDEPDAKGYIYKGLYTAICASGAKILAVTELYDNK